MISSQASAGPGHPEVLTVYAIGLFQGLSLVVFPAAAGWLVAAYRPGYGLAAFGAGVLQRVTSLSAVCRVAGVAVIAMSVLAIAVARHQRPAPARPSVEAATGS